MAKQLPITLKGPNSVLAVTILAEGFKHSAIWATSSSNSSGKVTEFMKTMLASLKSTFAKLLRINLGNGLERNEMAPKWPSTTLPSTRNDHPDDS